MGRIQPTIIRFESLPSTNSEAARRAVEGAAEGLCIIAGEQTAGRGRLDRKWTSPAGAGLYFSVVLRSLTDARAWPLLPLMAALAVHDALRDTCALESDIKWPNDILVNDRKLCGILAETIETDSGRAVILGIGINVTSDAWPPELAEIAISIAEASSTNPDADTLLQSLLRALGARYESLLGADGPEKIRSEWTRLSSYSEGRRVRVVNGSEILEGTTRGLESDGALRVETDAGEMKVVRAGDVTTVRPAHD